jgi:hypothetical protein
VIHQNSTATIFSDMYMYVSGAGFSPTLMWLVVIIMIHTFNAVQTEPTVTWKLYVYANFWHTEYIWYISHNGGLQVRPTKETITVEFTILILYEWTSFGMWEPQNNKIYKAWSIKDETEHSAPKPMNGTHCG